MNEKEKYQIVNGTYYNIDTPKEVISWLETSRERRQRIRIFYGYTEIGKDWTEENDTQGYIGRSTGTIKIPLLIKNSRSIGGGAILDNRIVKITTKGSDGKTKIVYQNKNYKLYEKNLFVENSGLQDLPFNVIIDDELKARFKVEKKAEDYIRFLKGEINKF